MAVKDSTIQTEVGRERGGEVLFIDDGGKLKLYDDDWYGGELKNFFTSLTASAKVYYSVTLSAMASSRSQVSAGNGVIVIYLDTGYSLLSLGIPDASKGMIFTIDGSAMAGDANIIMHVSQATSWGVSLQGMRGSDLSSINLSAGAYVKMACNTDDVWCIVDIEASATERPSS